MAADAVQEQLAAARQCNPTLSAVFCLIDCKIDAATMDQCQYVEKHLQSQL